MTLYTRKRARRSLFDTAIFRAAGQVATLLSYVVMVRAMSEQEFGIYNLLYAVIPVVSTVASFGLEQTLRRYQPEYLQADNRAAAARLVSIVGGVRFTTTLVVLGLILMLWDTVAPPFQLGPYRPEFVIFGVVVVLHFQARVLNLTLASHMLHRYAVGMFSVLSLVKLVGYSAFSAYGLLTLKAAIVTDILAYALTYAGLYGAYRWKCRPPAGEKFRFGKTERSRLFRYGFVYNFNDAGSFVLSSRADNFFIAALMSPVAVGAYSFYTRLSRMAATIRPTRMFENVVQPMFFATAREHAPERMPRYFTALLDTSLLVQVPLLAYGAVYHHEIVSVLFAGKFLEHSVLLPIVLAFAAANAISNPVTLVAQYQEKALIILLSKIFVVYNVIALLLLIPWLGVLGAVIATGTAELFKNLFIWWHVRHLARWGNAYGMISSSAAIWGVFVATGLGLKRVLPPGALLHMITGAVLATAAGLIYLRSTALSADDRTLFARVLHGREARALRLLGVVPATGMGSAPR